MIKYVTKTVATAGEAAGGPGQWELSYIISEVLTLKRGRGWQSGIPESALQYKLLLSRASHSRDTTVVTDGPPTSSTAATLIHLWGGSLQHSSPFAVKPREQIIYLGSHLLSYFTTEVGRAWLLLLFDQCFLEAREAQGVAQPTLEPKLSKSQPGSLLPTRPRG